MRKRNNPSDSELTQSGELVIEISYYLRDEKEVREILYCKNLLVEKFIALDHPTNVFGVMYKIRRIDKEWEISSAHTYKPEYENKKHLMD